MWRNFGALMGAVSKITGLRVIQPGSVITRRTRDPRVPPVVFNFSICSCTYPCMCVCASTCKHGRSRAVFCTVFLAIYRNGTKQRPISPCFCIRRGRGMCRFFHQKDREPIDSSSFFLLVVRSNDFSSYPFFSELNAENLRIGWKFSRGFGLILDWDWSF